MNKRLLTLLLSLAAPALLGVTAHAAAAPTTGPDPREIPLPVIKTSLPAMPGVNELPVRKDLPDIMTMNDGTKVKTVDQWKKRREEMKTILQYYSVGAIPPAPGNVKGTEIKSEMVLGGTVKYRLVHLTFGPQEKLGLDIGIFTPAQGGPFPAIISQSGTPPFATPLPKLGNGPGQGEGLDVLLVVGPDRHPDWGPGRAARAGRPPADPKADPAETVAAGRAELFRRGYALVVYNNNDCAEDTTLREKDGTFSFRTTRFFPAYPTYDWGVLAAWAWGASRIADYLETDAAIDKTKLIITGASRAGKSSMVAAAFDNRLMGAPVVTGGGGVGAYRIAGPRNSETLDVMEKKYANWFGPNLHQFWGQREKLPFDEHWFLALAAPKPFIALEGITDTISYPVAVKASMDAARPAYALYGKPDALGVHYSNHAHAFTDEDWSTMLNFADEQLRGKLRYDRFPVEAELDAALKASGAAPRPPAGAN